MTPGRKNLMGLAASRYKRAFGMRDNPGEGCYQKAVGRVSLADAARVFFVAVTVASPVGMAATARGAEPAASVVMEAGGVRRYSFPPPAEMTRADVYTWNAQTQPRAVLVLCPGFNGNGEALIRQPAWQEFARANQLALCAISFVSPQEEVQALRGYIHASRGSGNVLLKGIRLGLGRDLPILIYGFSCGGRFAISVADWKPAQVLSWCAYSASWWEDPQVTAKMFPPGIVACGEEDAVNYGTSTTLFARGRASGLPWTWVSLGHVGHVWSEPLNRFVRAYFAAIMRRVVTGSASGPVVGKREPRGSVDSWWDVDTKEELSRNQVVDQPILASWLPDRSLSGIWNDLHCP